MKGVCIRELGRSWWASSARVGWLATACRRSSLAMYEEGDVGAQE